MAKILKKTIIEKWGKTLYVNNEFLVWDQVINSEVKPNSKNRLTFYCINVWLL